MNGPDGDAVLVLASQSASRRAMLDAAGVTYEALPARIDEEAIQAGLEMTGAKARDIVDALAEAKAMKLSMRLGNALVLGSDSMVALDGHFYNKPGSRAEAEAHLRAFSGKPMELWSAAVIAERGQPVWRHVDKAILHVRPLSDAFIADYLEAEWPAIGQCAGCFRIEGRGVQLFSKINGNQFTILGMPLLPVLDYLRTRKVLTA